MAIYQETSSVQDSSGAAGIITNKRSIDTNVLVDDGEIIVLGGLIDDSTQDGTVKVPGLGDIPLIGNLFKYQKRSRVKTNLMVFLRPTVIRNNAQSTNLASDRYNYIRNEETIAQPENKLTLPNMGAPILPELTDGKMNGGVLFNRMDNGPLFSAPKSDTPVETTTESAQPSGTETTPQPETPPDAAPQEAATTE
jgi:general secretion pathway protein D